MGSATYTINVGFVGDYIQVAKTGPGHNNSYASVRLPISELDKYLISGISQNVALMLLGRELLNTPGIVKYEERRGPARKVILIDGADVSNLATRVASQQ